MKYLITLLTLTAFVGACNKQKGPELPPLSHEGKNILAFKIGSKVYLAQGELPTFGGFLNYYNYAFGYRLGSDSSLYVSADNEGEDQNFRFSLKTDGHNGSNRYDLVQTDADVFFQPFKDPQPADMFVLDTVRGGYAEITYIDSAILAGTFDIFLTNGQGTSLHITDGRFDLKP